jgi:hypothetical protein
MLFHFAELSGAIVVPVSDRHVCTIDGRNL